MKDFLMFWAMFDSNFAQNLLRDTNSSDEANI